MFKVSFYETKKNPYKVVVKGGNKTNVYIKGVVKLPKFWIQTPHEVMEWVHGYKHLDIYENMANNTLMIYSVGTSKCAEEDKYDAILGERIAEGRAKYEIYDFFYKLTDKLYNYYKCILVGNEGKVQICEQGGLIACKRKYARLRNHELNHLKGLIDGRTE